MINHSQHGAAIESIAPLMRRYRAVILDLWGVVHDGVRAFPEAVHALVRLRNARIPVCLLSNAPRRASDVAAHLETLGIEPKLYSFLITSGEETFAHMVVHFARGRHFHIGPSFLAGLACGTGSQETTVMADADIVLCTGTDRIETVDDVMPALLAARSRNLPMLCANPDREVLIGDRRVLCAGAVAHAYEGLGGKVLYFGKPHAAVYRRALALLERQACDVLAIGDGLATDIRGANRAGVSSVFVTGGIHRDAFEGAATSIDPTLWRGIANAHGARLDHLIARLQW